MSEWTSPRRRCRGSRRPLPHGEAGIPFAGHRWGPYAAFSGSSYVCLWTNRALLPLMPDEATHPTPPLSVSRHRGHKDRQHRSARGRHHRPHRARRPGTPSAIHPKPKPQLPFLAERGFIRDTTRGTRSDSEPTTRHQRAVAPHGRPAPPAATRRPPPGHAHQRLVSTPMSLPRPRTLARSRSVSRGTACLPY